MKETNVDKVFQFIRTQRQVAVAAITKHFGIKHTAIAKMVSYMQSAGLVQLTFHQLAPTVLYVREPQLPFETIEENELLTKLKFFKSMQDVKSANKLVMDVYNYYKRVQDPEIERMYMKLHDFYRESFSEEAASNSSPVQTLASYSYVVEKLPLEVDIIQQPLEPVPFYMLSILKVSDVTAAVINQIKEEVITALTTNVKNRSMEQEAHLRHEFEERVKNIMAEVFSDLTAEEIGEFSHYIIMTSVGMGEVEFLLHDSQLEEIVVNNAFEPVRVYHKNFGWMETNIIPETESKIVHYAMLAGRNVDKTITTLYPLMDAHLRGGDRVNATLNPISTKGSTITIRKFAESPWTITDFLSTGTIDYESAALIWTAIQYELSLLIVGGTGSGKTSALNVFSLFIVPNQRIVSIEDTREIRLPTTLHWIPMETRLPNSEGKGEVTMLDLVVNALRMRPDRIIVGEIRRKNEAEVLFEAMHTGHSVYATLHANTVEEAVVRLTTDPIGISKTLLSALDLIVVQNRNRRTNQRRMFQLAEMKSSGDYNLLFGYNFKEDRVKRINKPSELYTRLELFSGLTPQEVDKAMEEKIRILKYFVDSNIRSIEEIGVIISHYYTDPQYLMKKLFG